MATKLVSLSGQFALAWLLMPTDMGLAALALSVANIVSLVGPASLNTILIQRESEFDALAPKVFWLAVFLGSVAGLVVLGSAPIAARVLNEPRVAPLIAILALNLPISAFPVLYSGELYRGLRFRTVSLVHLSSAVVQWGSAVATAAAGFGAYALVVPIVLAGAFAAAAQRLVVGPIVVGRPTTSGWRDLFSSTVWLLAFVVGSAVGAYGANLAIGLSKSPEIVGLYFWGFTLSVQAVFFVSGSLRSVLFPAFAKLSQEPARRAAALRSAARLMVAASAPICVLQAVLATPLLRLFFPERWMAAAPVIGLLSLGVVGQPLTALGNALLMAAGEFRRLALLTAIQASLVITPIALAARLGGVAEIAACGAVGVFLSNALLGVSCFKFTGLPIHLLISDSMPTLTAALGAGGIAWLAAHTLNESRPVAGALLSSTVFVVSFLLVGLAVARPVAVEILSRVRGAVSATRAS